MLILIARRILHSVPLLFGIVTLIFFLMQLAPGDPIDAMIGDYPVSDDYRAMIAARYGLDDPIWQRYLNYLGQVVTLDLGQSLARNVPVTELIGSRVVNTLLLTGSAMILATVVGTALGLWAGVTRRNWIDNSITGTAVGLLSVPSFWMGQLAIAVFAIQLGLLPSQGMFATRSTATGFAALPDLLVHMILPVAVLAMREIGVIARILRTSVHETLTKPFVETARGKGLSRSSVIRNHVTRNSMLPVVTVVGYNLGTVLAGSILVETVFGWPGIGQLLYESIRNRDNAVTIGIVLLIGVSVVIINLITDIVYGVVDPRVRAGMRKATA